MEQLSLDCEEEHVTTELKLLECPRCRKPSKWVEVMPGARVKYKMCWRCEELIQEGI